MDLSQVEMLETGDQVWHRRNRDRRQLRLRLDLRLGRRLAAAPGLADRARPRRRLRHVRRKLERDRTQLLLVTHPVRRRQLQQHQQKQQMNGQRERKRRGASPGGRTIQIRRAGIRRTHRRLA
ncbi:hypothetical protein SCH01S_15_00330 [Sphingomonas changbaiensis NBRC 104936]|uniref:Uncharacterized protein n=1 Tax=Sphingomonas changbaiensis NBRC 104936 TaxID=1219043 RepID=A0A0E9MLP1_9SPHN|nr:hypothetical protein SCH01S_15_00330 [Sphingomonas changbaiensis NBRC 104936]